MHSTIFTLAITSAIALVMAHVPVVRRSSISDGVGPSMKSISRLTFGPNGVLYAADPKAAKIYALELGKSSAAAGTKDIARFDREAAAMLGTGAEQISVSDLAVDPRTGNSYLAVMRGQTTDAKPVLMRIDGAGKIDVVSLETLKFSSVALPNAPDINNRMRDYVVTDMVFQNGQLYVTGLSNEEFSSKLWTVPYPFKAADNGTSVEIFHGTHGGLETNSPVLTFVPYTVGNESYLIAGYLCTPLVKIPVSALQSGKKVTGTTIAELGAGNLPLDMILYKKDGKDYLLMSNSARGVMKISTDRFAAEPAITEQVSGTAGVPYETVEAMANISQLDLLDATHAMTLEATPEGAVNLKTFILP